MLRGPLATPGFRGQFSGHETFPLRYGWLNKAFDAVVSASTTRNKNLFTRDEAIADFGVGKNMVAAIKHWALASGMIEEVKGLFRPTDLGKLLMGASGLDPFLESPTSLWLIHWNIARNYARATTWYWAFGHYSNLVFDQDKLIAEISHLVKEQNWKRISPTTIKRDVECFIKMYASNTRRSASEVTEDSLESPLAELALIKPTGFRGSYQFQRGPKPSLPDAVFVYALDQFWSDYSKTAATLSMEAIAYEAGSPGRLFKLDEEAVIDRLVRIDSASDGLFRWTDTAGLSQVQRTGTRSAPTKILRRAYASTKTFKRAA